MTKIHLINNFDGIKWYGIFVDKKLVWTGCEDSCRDFAQVLNQRTKNPRVLSWRELRQYRPTKLRQPRWIDDGKPFEPIIQEISE